MQQCHFNGQISANPQINYYVINLRDSGAKQAIQQQTYFPLDIPL